MEIKVIDRETKKIISEEIYGGWAIKLLYIYKIFTPLRKLFSLPIFSKLYSKLQEKKSSKKKIIPFIKKYNIDSTEFEKKQEKFN